MIKRFGSRTTEATDTLVIPPIEPQPQLDLKFWIADSKR